MVRISQRKPGLRSSASREHGRYHKLIIIQPRNSGKLKLNLKVTHRTGLGAKFRPQISTVFYWLDLKNYSSLITENKGENIYCFLSIDASYN